MYLTTYEKYIYHNYKNLFQVPLPFPINMTHSNPMLLGPPPQMPHNGASHPLQSTQSGNNLSLGANVSNSMSNNIHPNHVNHHQQQQSGSGTTQQLQHCSENGHYESYALLHY